MSLTIREVINQLTQSGIDLDLQTNVDEIKFHPGNINAAELVGLSNDGGIDWDSLEDARRDAQRATSLIQDATEAIETAFKSRK